MNKELTIAIEELRQRPTDRAWFIPVMLSACQIPDRDIGAGETLRDIQWVELWRDWDSGMESLLKTLLPQRNESRLPSLDDSKQSLEDLSRPNLDERLEKTQRSLDDGRTRLKKMFEEENPHADQMEEVVADLAGELERLRVEVDRRRYPPFNPYNPGSTNDPLKALLLFERLFERRAPVAEILKRAMSLVFNDDELSIFTRVGDHSIKKALRKRANEIVLGEVLKEVLSSGATWKIVTPESPKLI